MVAGTTCQKVLRGGEDPKKKNNKSSAPALGQGDEAEVRHLEPGNIRD